MEEEAQKIEPKVVAEAKAEKPKPKAKPAAPATKYPKAEHMALARGMYGVPSHVVAGAFSRLDSNVDYTKSEVASEIKRFLNTEVKGSK